jgi:hypothetical protein
MVPLTGEALQEDKQMTAEEHGDASQNDQPGRGAWRLRISEKAVISAAATLVAFACALGQYITPGASGIRAFGISLGVSVAGGLLVVIAVRIFTNRKRKITILLLPALAAVACAGVIGGLAGYFLSRPVRAAAPPAPAIRQPVSGTASPTPATSASGPRAATAKTFTEIADNRNGVPVFGSPDGSATDAPEIPFATRVQVACYTPNESGMPSINAFYLIKSPPPWTDVYAPANTFANGDPVGQPGSTNIDPAVPRCLGT